MTRRQNVRERWAAAVLASDLNNATKVVMWALYRHMDEHGRVQHRRDDLAEECGLANARRVSDRIKEARDKGFLTARAGGVNGQVVQYYAELPGSQRQGPSSTGRGGGLQGPSNRDPQPTAGGRVRVPATGTHTRARYSGDPNNGTPPATERGSPEQNPGDWSSAPAAPPLLRLAPPVRRASA